MHILRLSLGDTGHVKLERHKRTYAEDVGSHANPIILSARHTTFERRVALCLQGLDCHAETRSTRILVGSYLSARPRETMDPIGRAVMTTRGRDAGRPGQVGP